MTRQSQLRDVPASVRSRLRNLARHRNVDFNLLLERYAAERFLYRLSSSDEADRFTLKGAALYRVWTEQELWPTRDVDFLGAGPDDHATMRSALQAICRMPCPEDGVVFDPASIRIDDIRRERRYGGLRARILGKLGRAQLHVQVDVGFGDVITPGREKQDYPTLLDLPVPHVWTYPGETLVAEKFEAMVDLGVTNSRVKDLWDLSCLARLFAFDGATLRAAIDGTFRRRQTRLADARPLALLPDYYEDTARAARWHVLRRQVGTSPNGPAQLVDAGEELRRFLGPVCESLIDDRPFTLVWPAKGPWRPGIHTRMRRDGGD